MHLIQEIGAVAGLAAFFALALLAFLYFAQAKRVRDLEEKATFVPEDFDLATASPGPAAEPATATQPAGKPKAAAASTAPVTAAAAQVEAARAKAERRARFEQRRRTPGGRPAGPPGRAAPPPPRRMPEPRAMLVIGAGVVVLVVGVVFAAGHVLGGGSSSGGGSGGGAEVSSGPPPEVAVLNGTSTAGLAAKVGEQARSAGFKLGPVTNTETPFDVTTVMFAPGNSANAQKVASKLQISKLQAMSSDIKKIAGGAGIAIVVGTDRAGA